MAMDMDVQMAVQEERPQPPEPQVATASGASGHASGLFDHCTDVTGCTDVASVWRTLHCVACACHPCQGGRPEDAHAVFAEARRLLGDAWPSGWPEPPHLPNLFDVYCMASDLPNPFGRSIQEVRPTPQCATANRQGPSPGPAQAADPGGYDPGASCFAPVRAGAGRAWLLPRPSGEITTEGRAGARGPGDAEDPASGA
jgi:hypothetical protein